MRALPFIHHPAVRASAASMNVRICVVTGTAELAVRELEGQRQAARERDDAPLAQALLGREAGDSVPFQGVAAEIVSIEP